MSQTFDEGGAKGLLLANLGVYDGAKILLNSADVRLATRRLIADEQREQESKLEEEHEEAETDVQDCADVEVDADVEADAAPEEEASSRDVTMAEIGSLACFSKDILVRCVADDGSAMIAG